MQQSKGYHQLPNGVAFTRRPDNMIDVFTPADEESDDPRSRSYLISAEEWPAVVAAMGAADPTPPTDAALRAHLAKFPLFPTYGTDTMRLAWFHTWISAFLHLAGHPTTDTEEG